MVHVDRRTLLTASAFGAAAPVAGPLAWGAMFNRTREQLPSGAQMGDVTTNSAVLWAQSSGPGRLHARVSSNGLTFRTVRGGRAHEGNDFTARIFLGDLAPGRGYDATVWFDQDGVAGEPQKLSFTTGSVHPAPTSLVWSGDTCGQGWGINPDFGGLIGYQAMAEVEPDLFVHCGDMIYADMPIQSTRLDGTQVWRNETNEHISKVAESLTEFRAHYRYNLSDAHVRSFNAKVPVIGQWDDHEVIDNWWPSKHIEDDRYTERSAAVLAHRAKRAWQEYVPVARDVSLRAQTAPEGTRIHRKVSRGAHLDVFTVDMRSYRDPNRTSNHPEEARLLGATQAEWLTREVIASTATWKVIAIDLPIGIACTSHAEPGMDSVADGRPGQPQGREPEFARILKAWKYAGVRNVVFVTADVHYTAAHHYSPERAAFTDFNPFWEFVSGPIHGSTFLPKGMDATFGPKVHFVKGGDSQSPRKGNQFFGQLEIDRAGLMTVRLRDIGGNVLWQRDLEPESN